jgi:hypothetical protein
MPVRRSPTSLKTKALQAITLNFEILCYGRNYAKGSKALANYIHTEGYKKIVGPFVDWPSSMLQDIISAIYRWRRSGMPSGMSFKSNFHFKIRGYFFETKFGILWKSFKSLSIHLEIFLV